MMAELSAPWDGHLSRVRGRGTLLPRTVRSRCTISTCTQQLMCGKQLEPYLSRLAIYYLHSIMEQEVCMWRPKGLALALRGAPHTLAEASYSSTNVIWNSSSMLISATVTFGTYTRKHT
jgi:hypothetical protein